MGGRGPGTPVWPGPDQRRGHVGGRWHPQPLPTSVPITPNVPRGWSSLDPGYRQQNTTTSPEWLRSLDSTSACSLALLGEGSQAIWTLCRLPAHPSAFQPNRFCSTRLGHGQALGLLYSSPDASSPSSVGSPQGLLGAWLQAHTARTQAAHLAEAAPHRAAHRDPPMASARPPVGPADRRHIRGGQCDGGGGQGELGCQGA